MKKRICFVCLITVFFSGMLFAQENKVVVVPLLGDAEAQAGGSDTMVQYNDNGKLEGAAVYYDKSNGDLGIGGTSSVNKFYVAGSGLFSQGGSSPPPGLIIQRRARFPLFAINWTEIDGNYLNAYWRSAIETGSTLYLNNESEGNVVLVGGGGSVGIGTTSPSYKLHVNGDAAGTSWTNLSSRDYKEEIQKVDEAAHPMMLAKLMNMDLTTYKYRKEYGGDDDRKLGFIAEDMPEEVLSKDGKGVDIYELLALTIGAMKAQQKENEMLKAKLEEVIARLETLKK